MCQNECSFSFWTVPISPNLTSAGCGIRWVWCLRSLYCSTNQWRKIFSKYRMYVCGVKSRRNSILEITKNAVMLAFQNREKSDVKFFLAFHYYAALTVHLMYTGVYLYPQLNHQGAVFCSFCLLFAE